MSVFQTFGNKCAIVAHLSPTLLYALSARSTTPKVRTEALEMIKQGKIVTPKTVTELRAKMREVKAQQRLAAEFNRKLSRDLRLAQTERDSLLKEKVMTIFNAIWSRATEGERDEIRRVVSGSTLIRLVSGSAP
jgi:hypothetical protein